MYCLFVSICSCMCILYVYIYVCINTYIFMYLYVCISAIYMSISISISLSLGREADRQTDRQINVCAMVYWSYHHWSCGREFSNNGQLKDSQSWWDDHDPYPTRFLCNSLQCQMDFLMPIRDPRMKRTEGIK